MNIRKFLFYTFGIILLIFASCKKESVIRETIEENTIADNDKLPPNPYNVIDYPLPIVEPNPDPNSLVGIHTNILQTRCALPGCHDGNFEPDFRTPQSSFATMVYHPVIKNNTAEDFTYRVIPSDTTNSVLHERITNCCFVNVNDRMPQDNIGQPLADEDINAISTWIMNGAPDMFGNKATFPNLPPVIEPFFLALDTTFTVQYQEENNRIDSVGFNPFILSSDNRVNMVFLVSDDSTATANLQVNELQLSLDPDDFSNAWVYQATYINLPPPEDAEIYVAEVETKALPINQIIYMRYVTSDGDQPDNTFFPTTNLPIQYKTFWSFYIN